MGETVLSFKVLVLITLDARMNSGPSSKCTRRFRIEEEEVPLFLSTMLLFYVTILSSILQEDSTTFKEEEECPLFLSTSAAGVSHKQLLLLECLLMGLKSFATPANEFFNVEPSACKILSK